MGVIKCVEKSSGAPHAKDAVWVPNGDQLYYPYVSSCVTVTLVFENGLLGGHASQVTADEKGDFRQALNLQEVIGRMKKEDPGGEKRGALKRIYFVGLVEVVVGVHPHRESSTVLVFDVHFGPVEQPDPGDVRSLLRAVDLQR